jgi:hypothetical protein
MKRRWTFVVLAALALAAVVGIGGFTLIKLDALQEPGRFETAVATGAKHFLIGWSSRKGIPPAPTNLPASVEEGDKRYATNCSMYHGAAGLTPTDTGRWMYSRRGSHRARGARVLRSRIVLDCKKRYSAERDARVWQGRVRRAHLELGPLRENASGRRKPSPEERRSHAVSALPVGAAFG